MPQVNVTIIDEIPEVSAIIARDNQKNISHTSSKPPLSNVLDYDNLSHENITFPSFNDVLDTLLVITYLPSTMEASPQPVIL